MPNIIKRVAAIHDLSGFGRCSLTTVIPILSAMKTQVCPVPTAVLSTHTGGFSDFAFIDLTDYLRDYIRHWKELKISFDCIYSGFLGSEEQFDIVSEFMTDFQSADTLTVVDPVLGDDGVLYSTITEQMADKMKHLITMADVITPNITEAAILLNETVPDSMTDREIKQWLKRLSSKGPKTVVITSTPDKKNKFGSVVCYDGTSYYKTGCDHIPENYPGTGDIFTSILTGALLNGEALPDAMGMAVNYVSLCMRETYQYKTPPREGVILEKLLDQVFSKSDIYYEAF